jgi:hypothetical protein
VENQPLPPETRAVPVRTPSFATAVSTMSHSERISLAKKKIERVVDHLVYLLELHENNAIISYSPKLSSQIPASRAANAFNVFQRGLYQFEIIHLCALWDELDLPLRISSTWS